MSRKDKIRCQHEIRKNKSFQRFTLLNSRDEKYQQNINIERNEIIFERDQETLI